MFDLLLLSFGIHPGPFIKARQAVDCAGGEPHPNESGSSVRGRPDYPKQGTHFCANLFICQR